MIVRVPLSSVLKLAGLVVAASLSVTPAIAERAPRARLVHCGAETCLRLSGYRSRPTAAIRVAGQTLAVEGGRAWRVTVPLTTARGWATSAGYSLTVTTADPDTGSDSRLAVPVPPGALGSRVELAALVVRAR